MSDQPDVDGNEPRKLECGHAESNRRIDWEVFPFKGVGEWGTPYICRVCELSVRDPAPPSTFAGHLATALVAVPLIVLLAVVGAVPYILTALWVMLAIGAAYISVKVVATVISVVVRLVVKVADNIRTVLQT